MDLEKVLAEATDLESVQAAVIRERVIRGAMAETGEPREVVADMLDAVRSMGQEAVLDLTEGEPTTLRAALERYVEQLSRSIEGDPGSTLGEVDSDLTAILAYPWPVDPELVRTRQERDQLKTKLARLVPDREHISHIHMRMVPALVKWLQQPNGSFDAKASPGFRGVVFEAGGPHVWVRTRPYRQQEDLGDDHHTLEQRAEILAQQIHGAYVRMAEAFDVPVQLWEDLEEYQRQLCRAVTRDLLGGERAATSYGIRPHLPRTREQDAQERWMAEQMPALTQDDLKRRGLL